MLGPTTVLLASVVLDTTDEQQTEISRLIDDAGPIAGLFVLVLGIALFLLWRSMSKQLKRIDPALPAGPDEREQQFDAELTERAVQRGEDAGDESPRA
ncbi:MAG: hypothetical protein IPO93_09270 [Actinobacteria bacterium]|nr:hypothetical protein [Actinomycetota bacterium]